MPQPVVPPSVIRRQAPSAVAVRAGMHVNPPTRTSRFVSGPQQTWFRGSIGCDVVVGISPHVSGQQGEPNQPLLAPSPRHAFAPSVTLHTSFPLRYPYTHTHTYPSKCTQTCAYMCAEAWSNPQVCCPPYLLRHGSERGSSLSDPTHGGAGPRAPCSPRSSPSHLPLVLGGSQHTPKC